jgi:hypothetical protein
MAKIKLASRSCRYLKYLYYLKCSLNNLSYDSLDFLELPYITEEIRNEVTFRLEPRTIL